MKEFEVAEKKLEQFFSQYVPAYGSADSDGGELVRAVMRILYRFYNDGDMIGIGYGNETCNAAARYIQIQYGGSEMDSYIHYIWGLNDEVLYEGGLKYLVGATVGYLEKHPEEFKKWNISSFENFAVDEDREWDEPEYVDYGYSRMEEDLRQYPVRDWRV